MKLGLCECFVLNDDTNECIIETDSNFETVDLYYSHTLDSFQSEHHLGRFKEKRFTYERIKNTKHRIYYWLVFDDGTKIQVGERILRIPGMYNLRDMGGYPTKDQRRVRWGLLYRGDQLFNLEEKGLNYVESLNFKTIIDFRSEKEIKQYPNKVPSTVTKSFNFSPEAEIAMFAGKLQNNEMMDDGDTLIKIAKESLAKNPIAGIQNMMDQQAKFVNDKTAIESFKNTIKIFANPNHAPIFQHCKGGKDRTGFAALIQLALLGVDEDYLIYDYMLTKKARAQKNKKYYDNFLHLTKDEAYADYFYALFDTKEEYIKNALSEIYKKYQSIEDYAKDKYDISEEDLEVIRNTYLEVI